MTKKVRKGRETRLVKCLPESRTGKSDTRDCLQQFQGTLQVTLRGSPSGQPIDDNEVRRKFQAFGDIKSIRPVNDRIECVLPAFAIFKFGIDRSTAQDMLSSMILGYVPAFSFAIVPFTIFSKNCDDAFNALRHQGLQDGVMDIVYAWDHTEGQSDSR